MHNPYRLVQCFISLLTVILLICGEIKQKVSEYMVSSSNTHYCTQRLSLGELARLQEQAKKNMDAEVQINNENQARLKELEQFREEQRIKEENLKGKSSKDEMKIRKLELEEILHQTIGSIRGK
eukprot:Pgem_evm1s12470